LKLCPTIDNSALQPFEAGIRKIP